MSRSEGDDGGGERQDVTIDVTSSHGDRRARERMASMKRLLKNRFRVKGREGGVDRDLEPGREGEERGK